MNIEHTIDAFLDGETVQPAALDAALAAAEGRAYLIDALAIRQLMSDAPVATAPVRRRHTLLFSARAAVLAVGLVGLGYLAGARTTPSEQIGAAPSAAQSVAPPTPTRIVELTPGVNWHESKGGD